MVWGLSCVEVTSTTSSPPFPGPDRDEALDRRRTMVDQRVVPLGPLAQLIDLLKLSRQQHMSVREGHVESVDLDLFAAQVAADAWNSLAIAPSYCLSEAASMGPWSPRPWSPAGPHSHFGRGGPGGRAGNIERGAAFPRRPSTATATPAAQPVPEVERRHVPGRALPASRRLRSTGDDADPNRRRAPTSSREDAPLDHHLPSRVRRFGREPVRRARSPRAPPRRSRRTRPRREEFLLDLTVPRGARDLTPAGADRSSSAAGSGPARAARRSLAIAPASWSRRSRCARRAGTA